MRLPPMSFFAFAALSLAVASTPLSATTITFTFSPPETTGTPFTAYTMAGFTVTNSGGQFVDNSAQGNPPPGITGGTVVSSPASAITLTDGGSAFLFTGFDVNAYTSPVSYTVTGSYKGSTLFTVAGVDSTTTSTGGGTWVTVDPLGISGDVVDSVMLSFTDTLARTEYGVDNLVATTVPEPTSFVLLGSGLVGFAAMARRRLFR